MTGWVDVFSELRESTRFTRGPGRLFTFVFLLFTIRTLTRSRRFFLAFFGVLYGWCSVNYRGKGRFGFCVELRRKFLCVKGGEVSGYFISYRFC